MNIKLYFINIWFLAFSSSYVIDKTELNVAHPPPRRILGVLSNHRIPVNKEMWTCGTRASQNFVFEGFAPLCIEKIPEMNMCCAVHDDCYELQLGKNNCDQHFCDCLTTAFTSTSNMRFSCWRLIGSSMCTAVRRLGDGAYKASMLANLEYYKQIHPVVDKNAIKAYSELYKNCLKITKSISSCAYNHNVCFVQFLPNDRYNQEYENCNKQLVTCLKETVNFLKKDDEPCNSKLEKFLDALEHNNIISVNK